MRILHYSLGLPPYRSGGLTKYSMDIMKEQIKQGDKVFLLFPGRIEIRNKRTYIKYLKKYDNIEAYEVVNPLPVSLLNGVLKPKEFFKKCDKNIYTNLLKRLDIEVVHIHTFMGLHKEMLSVCKELNIKIAFTTHDYYGLCTKVNFFNNYGQVCERRDINKCLKCNTSGFDNKKIYLLQSPIYRLIKSSKIFEVIKNVRNNKSFSKEQKKDIVIDKNEYEKLIKYYNDMFLLIDVFLFNSDITRQIYARYLNIDGEVLYITHSDIEDRREKKVFEEDKLRVTYLGSTEEYKGFNLLIEVMKKLEKKNDKKIILNVYGKINTIKDNVPRNVTLYGKYNQEQLKDIFAKTDLVIVPSIWYETYGFNTIEALSYGVPVITSDRVGSKILLEDRFKENIFKPNVNEIVNKIIKFANEKEILENQNKSICNNIFEFSIKNHVKRIKEFY